MLEIDEVVTREPLGVVDSIEIETITAGTTEEMPSLDN
jgi:hypothetical protein